MRVIVNCVPQTGHIMPLLPLAQAFIARGDEVLIDSGANAADAVSSRELSILAPTQLDTTAILKSEPEIPLCEPDH